MFTGIINSIGEVTKVSDTGSGRRLLLSVGGMDMSDVAPGDSIAVNGCCLTVLTPQADGFEADISNATLACTALGDLHPGSKVNLEKALRLQDRIGGHLVSGHVDSVTELISQQADGENRRLRFKTPAAAAPYITPKGSVCIDGVSLTVNKTDCAVGRGKRHESFTLNLIPHSCRSTTLGDCQPGQRFNLEVDLIARYLARLLHATRAEGFSGDSTLRVIEGGKSGDGDTDGTSGTGSRSP